MTLILTAATGFGVYQASDRRLTRPDGSLFDDESNKAICVRCRNAGFVIGYTGLAFIGSVSTDVWLVEMLARIRAGLMGINDISVALREELTDAFRRIAVPVQHRGLTLVMAGFHGRSIPVIAYISNLKNPDGSASDTVLDRFHKMAIRPGPGSTRETYILIDVQGILPAVTKPIARQFSKLVKKKFFHKSDQETVREKLVSLLRACAGTVEARNLVGKSCMSVAIDARSGITSSAYHPTRSSPKSYAPHFVGPDSSVWNVRMWSGSNPPEYWWKK
jgi:hypothetical protein